MLATRPVGESGKVLGSADRLAVRLADRGKEAPMLDERFLRDLIIPGGPRAVDPDDDEEEWEDEDEDEEDDDLDEDEDDDLDDDDDEEFEDEDQED
jgi:hypothetical protein